MALRSSLGFYCDSGRGRITQHRPAMISAPHNSSHGTFLPAQQSTAYTHGPNYSQAILENTIIDSAPPIGCCSFNRLPWIEITDPQAFHAIWLRTTISVVIVCRTYLSLSLMWHQFQDNIRLTEIVWRIKIVLY